MLRDCGVPSHTALVQARLSTQSSYWYTEKKAIGLLSALHLLDNGCSHHYYYRLMTHSLSRFLASGTPSSESHLVLCQRGSRRSPPRPRIAHVPCPLQNFPPKNALVLPRTQGSFIDPTAAAMQPGPQGSAPRRPHKAPLAAEPLLLGPLKKPKRREAVNRPAAIELAGHFCKGSPGHLPSRLRSSP